MNKFSAGRNWFVDPMSTWSHRVRASISAVANLKMANLRYPQSRFFTLMANNEKNWVSLGPFHKLQPIYTCHVAKYISR